MGEEMRCAHQGRERLRRGDWENPKQGYNTVQILHVRNEKLQRILTKICSVSCSLFWFSGQNSFMLFWKLVSLCCLIPHLFDCPHVFHLCEVLLVNLKLGHITTFTIAADFKKTWSFNEDWKDHTFNDSIWWGNTDYVICQTNWTLQTLATFKRVNKHYTNVPVLLLFSQPFEKSVKKKKSGVGQDVEESALAVRTHWFDISATSYFPDSVSRVPPPLFRWVGNQNTLLDCVQSA